MLRASIETMRKNPTRVYSLFVNSEFSTNVHFREAALLNVPIEDIDRLLMLFGTISVDEHAIIFSRDPQVHEKYIKDILPPIRFKFLKYSNLDAFLTFENPTNEEFKYTIELYKNTRYIPIIVNRFSFMFTDWHKIQVLKNVQDVVAYFGTLQNPSYDLITTAMLVAPHRILELFPLCDTSSPFVRLIAIDSIPVGNLGGLFELFENPSHDQTLACLSKLFDISARGNVNLQSNMTKITRAEIFATASDVRRFFIENAPTHLPFHRMIPDLTYEELLITIPRQNLYVNEIFQNCRFKADQELRKRCLISVSGDGFMNLINKMSGLSNQETKFALKRCSPENYIDVWTACLVKNNNIREFACHNIPAFASTAIRFSDTIKPHSINETYALIKNSDVGAWTSIYDNGTDAAKVDFNILYYIISYVDPEILNGFMARNRDVIPNNLYSLGMERMARYFT